MALLVGFGSVGPELIVINGVAWGPYKWPKMTGVSLGLKVIKLYITPINWPFITGRGPPAYVPAILCFRQHPPT